MFKYEEIGISAVQMQVLREPKLGIIGLGEVCLQRVIPALNSVHPNYSVEWVVSAQPKEQALRELSAAGANVSSRLRYYRNEGLLESLPNGADIVMDTSPSRYHTRNVELAAEKHVHFYTEKPSTVNAEGIGRISRAVSKNPDLLSYFVEYYRDEKGLMLNAALRPDEPLAISPGSWHEQFFVGRIPSGLQGSLDSIGRIVRITGTGIEDEGMTGDLTYKTWIGDRDQGGQFLDRSTHLISYLAMLGERVGAVFVEDVKAGICTKFDAAYRKATGGGPAETYAEVTLRSEHGFPILFSFGNYTGTNHRALQIEGDSGIIVVNFATQIMSMESRQFTGDVEVRTEPKYSILMSDLMRRYEDPEYHHQYGLVNSVKTLRTIIEARGMINSENTFYYEAGRAPGNSAEIMGMFRQ